jgi:predicted TPR repeat methyltransferase
MWTQLGRAQREQGDLAAAESSYRRALAIDGRMAGAHVQLAHVLKMQRRFAEAAESYFRAAQLDPRSPARDELLVFGYRKSSLDRALKSGVPPAAPPLHFVEAGDRARAASDWRGAARHFAEALRADPQWAAIWVQLGHAQKEQGDLAGAESSYRRALEIEPTVADTHLQLGHLLKKEGRFAEAAESYFAAVRLGPSALDGLYARGELIVLGYRSLAVDAALQVGSLPWPPPSQLAPLPAERPILSIIGAHLPPVKANGHELATVLRHPIRLPDREIGILIDVQMVSTSVAPRIEPAMITPAGEMPVRAVANSHGPNVLTFRLRPPAETDAEFVLRADLPADCVIRRIEIGAPDHSRIWPIPQRGPGPLDLPTDQARNFIIGTTGVCNASCPHCPTNKLIPSAQWASEMPLDVFHGLIDQIVESRMFITGHISLGLFGDGLLDRHVIERARRLRAAFPHAPLHVNTNAAAYNRQRHAALGSLIDVMAVHVETLDEEKYHLLMEPLRLKNVLPKIDQIIEDMAPIVHIASPMHQMNIGELEKIRTYFAERGVQKTIFTPISNRCSRDEIFQKLALGPKSGTCPEEIIFDLIVDWDGTVLVCCNDFLRQEPIGKLTEISLADILSGPKRQRVFDVLRTGTWQEMETCRTCKFDCGHVVGAE